MSFSSITSYQSSIFIDIKGHCQEIQDIFLVGPRKAFDYKIRLTRTPLFHIFLYFILRWKISLKTAINEGVLEHWLAQRDRSLLFLYCMLVIALTYTHQPTPIFQIRKSSCCKTFSVTIPRSHKRNKNKPFDLFFVLCNFYYFTSHFNIPNPPPGTNLEAVGKVLVLPYGPCLWDEEVKRSCGALCDWKKHWHHQTAITGNHVTQCAGITLMEKTEFHLRG